MIIDSLTLENFRVYSKKSLSFSPKITVIIGPNAVGKTNLLESIHILSTGKSLRAKDQDIISFGSELARIRAEILKNDNGDPPENTSLEVVVTVGQVMVIKTPHKKLTVNGVPKRMIDFAGEVKTVIFWPQQLELVTDSPAVRRKHLDSILSQIDKVYRKRLSFYEKGLRQRNRLLEAIRENQAGRNQLEYWNRVLIENGSYISQKREDFISFVNSSQTTFTGNDLPSFKLLFDKSEISEARLAKYQYEETAAGVTLVGPHRDNLIFLVEGNSKNKKLADFGSRGEQRLAVLWLSLKELAFIEGNSGQKPVLLLDDIFSELDEDHRLLVMNLIRNQQTVITTTDINLINNYPLGHQQLISLK